MGLSVAASHLLQALFQSLPCPAIHRACPFREHHLDHFVFLECPHLQEMFKLRGAGLILLLSVWQQWPVEWPQLVFLSEVHLPVSEVWTHDQIQAHVARRLSE